MDLLIQIFYGQSCSSIYNQCQFTWYIVWGQEILCGTQGSVCSVEVEWPLQMNISMSSCILTKECHSGTSSLSRITELNGWGGLLVHMLSVIGKLQPRLLKPSHLCFYQSCVLKSLGNPFSKTQNPWRQIEDTGCNGQIKVFPRPWQ